MAKLKGPLFSVDARGKLGNSLVFSGSKGINRASKHYKPHNPKTIIQQDNRTIFSYAILSWQSLDEGQKEDFNQSARNLGLTMSGYNYYLQTYLAAYGEAPPPPPPDTYILNGLISWWRMDENGGDIVYDSINTNHGTRVGGTWVPGKHNSALSHDGIDDRIIISNESAFDFEYTDPFSIMFWLKTDGINAYEWWIAKQLTSERGWAIWYAGRGGSEIFLKDNGSYLIGVAQFSKSDLEDNDWHFVAITYDGSNSYLGMKWYNDGVSKTITELKNGSLSSILHNGPVNLMASNYQHDAGHSLKGILDEVAIYNRVLSPAEILQNYEVFL